MAIPADLTAVVPGYLWWPGQNWFHVFWPVYAATLPLQALSIAVTYTRYRRHATAISAVVLSISGLILLLTMAVGAARMVGAAMTGPAMAFAILSACFALFMRLPPLPAVAAIATFLLPGIALTVHRAQAHAIPAIQAYPFVFAASLALFFIGAISVVGERLLRRTFVSEELLTRQRRDVDRVMGAAAAVEAATYRAGELDDLAGRDDAVGRLARVFDAMAVEVRVRETRLREQVRALRAEVAAARQVGPADPGEAPGDSLHTGDWLAGRYRITKALGRGGMGAVFRAFDRELGEEIALKVLRPDLTADASLLQRFRSEIRLARRITHRNVVRTHDIGESDGVYFLTMELVHGITVRELLNTRGRLGVDATLGIAAQLADALAVAHEAGIIHRDIKSQNLLLDEAGVLKVMDFGVARLAERGLGLTGEGIIVGTPAYMAPEQLMGEGVDARSDLYSTGVVLYECLAGRLPYEAANLVTLVAKQLSGDPPPLTSVNPDVSPPVAALVARLLAKAPEERLATADELRHEVAKLAG